MLLLHGCWLFTLQELEAERVELMEGVMANKRKMQELEENLLHKLTSTEAWLVTVFRSFFLLSLGEFVWNNVYDVKYLLHGCKVTDGCLYFEIKFTWTRLYITLFIFCQGSLVDDESVIEVLNVTKTTAAEVSEKLTVAADTEVKINVAREEFRPSQPPVTCLFFIADFLEVGLNSFIYTPTQALKLIPFRIFFHVFA